MEDDLLFDDCTDFMIEEAVDEEEDTEDELLLDDDDVDAFIDYGEESSSDEFYYGEDM